MLQGEALMNDATGLVTFKFALAAAITGVFSLANASLTFVLVACGGLAIGVALSWLVGRLRAWMIARGWDDPATHPTKVCIRSAMLAPVYIGVCAKRKWAGSMLFFGTSITS